MLDRMALLERFEPHEDCFPFFLWIDTDLAGTDALMLRFFWPLFGKKVSVRLSAGAHDHRELRFIPIEPPRVQQALDKLGVYLSQSITGRKKVTRAKAQDRYEQLKAVFLQHTSGGTWGVCVYDVDEIVRTLDEGMTKYPMTNDERMTKSE